MTWLPNSTAQKLNMLDLISLFKFILIFAPITEIFLTRVNTYIDIQEKYSKKRNYKKIEIT